MKLSVATIEILRNLSRISDDGLGILIKPGNVLRVMTTSKGIMAEARTAETFLQECAFNNLKKILRILALCNDAEVTFGEHSLIIDDGRLRTNIRYTDPKLVVFPKELPPLTAVSSLNFSQQNLELILKVADILRCPHIVLQSDGSKQTLGAADAKGAVVDDSSLSLGAPSTRTPYRFVMKTEFIEHLMLGDYEIEVFMKVCKFTSKNASVNYSVAVDIFHSTFDNKSLMQPPTVVDSVKVALPQA